MRWTLLTLAMLLPLSAWGQSDGDCTAIENEVRKTDCYILKGEFIVKIDKSNFDDSTTVTLFRRANETLSISYGGTSRPIFYIRCMENTTAMFVNASGMYLASGFDGYGRVDYRVDDRPAGVWSMQESTDNEALGLWRGSQSIPAIKGLFGGDVLRVKFTPFNESPVEVTFNIAGLEEQIVPLREACNW